MKDLLGYNINTGLPVKSWDERMVHVGNGFYERACDITKEDLSRRQRFFASLDAELTFAKMAREEH
jgi:hypothetical protein